MIDPQRALIALEQLAAEVPVLLADADLAAPVPSCPDWTVAELVAHLGETHLWAERCVRVGDPQSVEVDPPTGDRADLAGWYRDCADTLLATLRTTSPDAPCWAFGPPPREAMFWFRRQAHEVAVHRWDLAAALARHPRYPAELAADGIDEVVTMFFPRQVRLGRTPPLTRSLAVVAVEGPTWTLQGDGTGEPTGAVDATVTGPADALVLLLWGRVRLDDTRLTVAGSPEAAAAVLGAGIVP